MQHKIIVSHGGTDYYCEVSSDETGWELLCTSVDGDNDTDDYAWAQTAEGREILLDLAREDLWEESYL